jgi:hypothetical protein
MFKAVFFKAYISRVWKLLMKNIILRTKQQSMEVVTLYIRAYSRLGFHKKVKNSKIFVGYFLQHHLETNLNEKNQIV